MKLMKKGISVRKVFLVLTTAVLLAFILRLCFFAPEFLKQI